MKMRTERMILLTSGAKERLHRLLKSVRRFVRPEPIHLLELEEALEDAQVMASGDIPGDVVTVNSTVKVTDLESRSQKVYTLVFPCDANYSASKISILAPLGAALLGYRPGDVVLTALPGGERRMRIEEVVPAGDQQRAA